jgi:hypothetical protein
VAEREGFEPSEEETPFNGLANRRTRPLCDLSASGADDSMGHSRRPISDQEAAAKVMRAALAAELALPEDGMAVVGD